MDRVRDVGVGCAHGAGLHGPTGVVRGSQAGAKWSSMISEEKGEGGGHGAQDRAFFFEKLGDISLYVQ